MPVSTRARLVVVAGDSFAMQYDNLVVADGPFPLVYRSYLVKRAQFTQLDGVIDATTPVLMENALLAAQVMVESKDGRRSANAVEEPRRRDIAQLAGMTAPFLVLSFGNADVIRNLLTSWPADDVELPPAAALRWPSSVNDQPLRPGALGWRDARHRIWLRLQHIRPLIVRLRKAGFSRLGMLAVPPPFADDREFAVLLRAVKLPIPSTHLRCALRYKLAAASNELLAWICGEEDVRFVDTWPMLTQDGALRAEVSRSDRIHFTDDAVAELAGGPIAAAAYEALRDEQDDLRSAAVYRPGSWIAHDAIAGAALVKAPHGVSSVAVHRVAFGLDDVWDARRTHPATDAEISFACDRAAADR